MKTIRTIILATKYWLHGDEWWFAWGYAKRIVYTG